MKAGTTVRPITTPFGSQVSKDLHLPRSVAELNVCALYKACMATSGFKAVQSGTDLVCRTQGQLALSDIPVRALSTPVSRGHGVSLATAV